MGPPACQYVLTSTKKQWAYACMYMPKWWFVKTVPCLLYMYVVTAFGINDDIALTMITQPFTCSVQSVVSA